MRFTDSAKLHIVCFLFFFISFPCFSLGFLLFSVPALCAVPDQAHHRFLVGTGSVRDENEVHLVEYDEDQNTLSLVSLFSHPAEVWALCSSPTDPALFFSSSQSATWQNKATLWQIPSKHPAPAANDSSSGAQPLQEVLTIPDHASLVKCIAWGGYEDPSAVLSVDCESVRFWKITESTIKSAFTGLCVRE